MHSTTFIFVAIFACTYAQVSMPPGYETRYPQYYHYSKQARHPRDVTWEKQDGKGGKVYGTLGQTDDSLFGKAGYKKEIFNDDRGKLVGDAYGARVLGAAGDSSAYGGKLDWSNNGAKAGIDINKAVGGAATWTANADKVWNFDKNTRLSAGGFAAQEFGRGKPDYGLGAKFEANW